MEKNNDTTFRDAFYSFKEYKGSEILRLDLINAFFFTNETFMALCRLINEKKFEALLTYKEIKIDTQDYIRVVLLKDTKDACFMGIIIDPVELWEDVGVMKMCEINNTVYDFLLQNRVSEGTE